MSQTSQLKCKRHGCLKKYLEADNQEGCCHYHPGKPIFHDTKKGWTCCNKIVYDWDQFQKLTTCATGKHTQVKEQGNEFYKSNTVNNAAKAIEKEKNNIVIKDINEYNKCNTSIILELQKKKKEQEKSQKTIFITKEGKWKCINQGCLKDFQENDNHEDACCYHKGQPVFHDLKKYWSCCGKQTLDWDEFIKLPTCCKGWHSPKYI